MNRKSTNLILLLTKLGLLGLTLLLVGQTASAATIAQQAYLKASNTDSNDAFAYSLAVSGSTVVVGASAEASKATGVNGDQTDNTAASAGAAYVFVRDGTNWNQQAYLKASNTDAFDLFGSSIAISGNTVVVGAAGEASTAIGINGNQTNNAGPGAGAVYIFVRDGTNWTQQAYLKPSNTGGGNSFSSGDSFGWSVAISGDTVVVGAIREESSATGVNGNQNDNNAFSAGAAYVFVRTGTNWSQQAYLKASNTEEGDNFGNSVAVSGNTVVVAALNESSSATGVNGNQANNSALFAGAAYVFVRNGTNWSQQAYLKASNTEATDNFGYSVALSGDTAVIGALYEDSKANGVNGNQAGNTVVNSGAAYVFVRSGTTWSQQAYLKASNTGEHDVFGRSLAVSGDLVIVGAPGESSSATGVNGNGTENNAANSGAAYVFARDRTNWSQVAYLKASNTGEFDFFGRAVAVSGDIVVANAPREDSNAVGVNGNGNDNNAVDSGAAYIFAGLSPTVTLSREGAAYFIRGNGIAGVSYQLQRATTATGPWVSNATVTATSPGLIEFHDTNAPSGQAFYRIAQP